MSLCCSIAGHGLQVHGKNYLVPVDAEIEEVGELKFNTVLFDDVLEPMTRLSKTALVFLDACRDNPFARNIARSLGQRSISGGLAEIKSDEGSFIAFATAPDKVAFDGHGQNSPFTSAMLENLGIPGLSLSDMMIDVRNAVHAATKGKQVPWEHSSLFSKFYFVPEEIAPAPTVTQSPTLTGAAEEWASLHNTTSLATLALFKERYPDPPWSDYADIRADELRLADQKRKEEAEVEMERAKAVVVATVEPPAGEDSRQKAVPVSREKSPALQINKADHHSTPLPWRLIGAGGLAIVVVAALAIWQQWKDQKVAVNMDTNPQLQLKQRQSFEPEMVRIPGGTFQMGCVSGKACQNDEKPVHSVTVQSFYLGKYEVTVGEYMACVKAGQCKTAEWQESGSKYNIKTGSDNHYKKLGSALTYDRHPIVGVSWKDARSYVKWLTKKTGKTYHLPTEAEWEYAARGDRSGNNKTKYGWGNYIGQNRANCGSECGDKWNFTAPVGSFPSNDFGLHDMHGNVWEWVEDCYHENYKEAPTDGRAWTTRKCSRRVVRGGSWNNDPWDLRSAGRFRNATVIRYFIIGFRLARTLNAKR